MKRTRISFMRTVLCRRVMVVAAALLSALAVTTSSMDSASASSGHTPDSPKTIGWVVGLTANYHTLSLNSAPQPPSTPPTTTLTATTDMDVGPTPYYIQIWDTAKSPATLLAFCGSGTSCTASYGSYVTTTDSFVATIGTYTTTYPPSTSVATSPENWVTWLYAPVTHWTISLSAPPYGGLNGPVTVTATTSSSLSSSQYELELFNLQGHFEIGSCSTGTGCSVSISYPANMLGGCNDIVAFIANPGAVNGTPPEPDTQASSNTVTVCT